MLLCPRNSPGKNAGVGSHSLLQGVRDIPSPGVEPRSPSVQADSSPSKPPGKPLKDNGGGVQIKVLEEYEASGIYN